MKKIVVMALALCLGMSILAEAKSKKSDEGEGLSTGMAGRLGVGLEAQDPTKLSTLPVLTGRYWLSDRLGIDAALGFSTQTQTPATGSAVNTTQFALAGGARFVLAAPVQELLITANGKVGVGTSYNGTNGDNNTSSFTFGLGVGIGFEAFIPAWKSLSVEGALGLGLSSTSTTTKAAGVSSSSSDFKLGTEGSGSTPVSVGIKYYFN
jgi:hypothetical protein